MELTKEEKEWIAEKTVASKQFQKIMGFRIPVRDVPEDNSLFSFTSSEPAIYLKRESPLTDGLSDKQKRRIRYGAFISELLMIQFTDFDYAKSIANRLAEQRNVFLVFSNIIEKGASRRFAPSFIGGKFLNAYNGYLSRVTDILPAINDAETELKELVYALMHIAYSDTIKGKFKSRKVREIMKDIYPVMIKAMDCPDPEERIDFSLSIMNMSKPVWIAEMEKLDEFSPFKSKRNFIEELFGSYAASLLSGLSGSGTGTFPEELDEEIDYSLGSKRESVWNEINEEEEEEIERKKKKGEKKGERKTLKNLGEKQEYAYSAEGDIDLSTENDFDAEDEEENLEAEDFFEDLIRRELEIDMVDSSSTSKTPVPDFREVKKSYTSRNYSCKNILVNASNHKKCYEIYNEIITRDAGNINNAYKKLDKIFKAEGEKEEYRSSGKISMKKVASGKVSSKLFTKKVEPDEKRSIALLIAVDQSGSMCGGGRMERAKAAAMDISEVFSKLDIPIYVMGFTADQEGADAVHKHYLQWHTKSKMDRATIACMQAEGNNFDGYSIRTAAAILSKRPELHKILMVISDGQPACNAYRIDDMGFSDTIDAIQNARDAGISVLGFGIGTDIEILKKFYQDDFVYINVTQDLFSGMMDKITTMVKKW